MHCGVSTACLYPALLEDSLAALLDLGFQEFEFFINTASELAPGYLRNLRRQLDAHAARVCSLHPFTSGYESFLLFSGYERRFRDALEFYKRYFAAAQQLGAHILVLHGQRLEKAGDMSETAYFAHYHALWELGQTYGVTVAQENVNLFRSSDPAFLSRMRAALGPACAFVLDIKQAARAGQSVFETAAAMGERLVHLHLNDHAPGHSCLLPGQGVADYPRLLRQLQRQGFRGDGVVEVYRSNFKEPRELLGARDFVQMCPRACVHG